jgi:hypothetical protein
MLRMETTEGGGGMTVAETDLAWMAAVIDVKGAVTVKRNKMRRTPQVVLYVSTKEARVARRLGSLTGVAPEPHERQASPFARRGCREHCLEPHIHVREDGDYPWQMPEVTRWSLTGAAMAVVLLSVRPYMVTYGEYAADVALVLENLVVTGQGAGMVRSSVDRLRELGWTVPPEIEKKMNAAAQPALAEQKLTGGGCD